ncbi:3'-5' exonuclease [Salmonella enterica]|uniref:3'-5' exonuclease n=1 Tax=Salmonella enterica TaxID=28901 RepID=A0A760AE63_SALER|nr:3'-5' exonuclease [Salmonella enterica]EBX2707311.1 3'-5' exonuclease [Salmonella enterica subsp. enterica serovar Bredeney]EIM5530187.1 3'-5' exoribonuclease [Salmonella enterica subsp. enterica]EBY2599613.1 3'-5' exonuclease [Salmonella enterica subsp. enterica serovar Bredeney]EEM9512538.1 3'-5' exonuclease [Salmonella enterica]
MKPAPGAEPVRWYKNGYGSTYGVYRIADCVPLREKTPRTEKQRQAGARLGLQARMKSERGKAARLAHTWLSQDPVFLDTETTGLDAGAQALEIGLVNARGDLIYETRLKPTVSIDPAAAAVHGISEAMLADAPAWPDIAQQLQHHIDQRPLVIFNADFDMRILKQTAEAHNDPVSWLDTLTVYCAMRLAAGYYGPTNRYGTISLASAASQAGLNWSGRAHSAVADAVMTAGVVRDIAEYWRVLQCEMNDDAGSESA